MAKRFILLLLIFSVAGTAYAQWTKKDSLKLQRVLNGKGELKLNPEAVKRIHFGNVADSVRISEGKPWLQPDETLPEVGYTEIKGDKADSLYRTATERKDLRLSLKPLKGKAFVDSIPPGLKKGMGLMLPPPEGISLGNGYRLNGGTVSGFDFMYFFSKDFWCRKRNKRRERTQDVLLTY